jgi:hypothetical protein
MYPSNSSQGNSNNSNTNAMREGRHEDMNGGNTNSANDANSSGGNTNSNTTGNTSSSSSGGNANSGNPQHSRTMSMRSYQAPDCDVPPKGHKPRKSQTHEPRDQPIKEQRDQPDGLDQTKFYSPADEILSNSVQEKSNAGNTSAAGGGKKKNTQFSPGEFGMRNPNLAGTGREISPGEFGMRNPNLAGTGGEKCLIVIFMVLVEVFNCDIYQVGISACTSEEYHRIEI